MGRKWVIADIHGCYQTLKALLEHGINPGNEDHIYFLGDYIDRGPGSRQVIDYLRTLQQEGLSITTLMGNHEEGMLNAWKEAHAPARFALFGKKYPAKSAWYSYGGEATMRSFGTDNLQGIPEDYIEWIEQLTPYAAEEKFLLAHAGFNFRHDDIFADTEAMRWVRDFEVDMTKTGGRRVIHGHVPVSLELVETFVQTDRYPYIDLDNGCVYKGRQGMGNLVALDLDNLELKIQPNLDA